MGNNLSFDKNEEYKHKAGIWQVNKPITGFKKIQCFGKDNNSSFREDFIAKVEIPQGAMIVRPFENCASGYDTTVTDNPSNKVRANQMILKEIFRNELYPNFQIQQCYSKWDSTFKYEEGKTYTPDKFNTDVNSECTHGLYFFLEQRRAEQYM